MIHGYVEITPSPTNKETCQEIISRIRSKYGDEPLGCFLDCKYRTETEFKVMCFFMNEEGQLYASNISNIEIGSELECLTI